MPVTLQIEGWEASGLRCPNHRISFIDPDGEVYPISLVQMPNGTGKTTTLQLLRVTLSGGPVNGTWSKHKVRTFAKQGNNHGEGKFVVHLLLDGRKLTLASYFNFDEGTIRYTTTIASGIQNGHLPPRQIARFLRPGFVDFFVFDGELAERLLSHDHTNAEQAIEDLFQIALFSTIQLLIIDYWNEKVKKKGPGEQKGLTQRRNRVNTLQDRVSILRRRQQDAKEKYENLAAELGIQKSRFDAALQGIAEFGERITRADAELASARSDVRSATSNLLTSLRSPEALCSSFALEMLSLKNNLDRVKLPESAAREFFEELACEQECICGRPLDEALKSAILSRAGQYLGSDDVALLNAIKSDIADRLGTDPITPSSLAKSNVQTLRDAARIEMEAHTARDLLQGEGVASDPNLEKARVVITELERRTEAARKELEKYDNTDDTDNDEHTFGLRVLEKRLENAERMLAETTATMEMKAKRDTLQELLAQIQLSARQQIGKAICEETNRLIGLLMPDNRIRVERIDRCLVLRDQDGGSVGETLSVAYAFLSTLFNRTDHHLPFVVDSPANSIDLRVRAKVAELIPRLTNQFIAFTISSERQSFLEPLEQATNGSIQYLTLFRKGSVLDTTVGQHTTEASEDGVCVHGRDFFRSFHIDEESSNAV